MPPRLPVAVDGCSINLNSLLLSLPFIPRSSILTKCSSCLFSTTHAPQAKSKRRMNKNLDPYRAAQARQRKAANLTRRAVLRRQEEAALGDPIRSRPTPFLEAFKSGAPVGSSQPTHVNHYIENDEIERTLQRSKWLTEPIISNTDPERETEAIHKHETDHDNAAEAMQRITALDIGSGRDKTRLNIQRCIAEFGRHNTDNYLPPKPASTQAPPVQDLGVPIRSGPDTGSSEVQAAILTAKINVLADNLHNKDKHNKRNLRLLVHKRQKHLAYLRRKERGGPRWQNLVDKLGINDAMWKGEISL